MARVLLIDDDRAGLEIRKLVIERHGHVAATASDPDEARLKFQSFSPEVAMLDLRLPQLEHGLNLIREFRAAAPALRIVVICGNRGDLDGRPEESMADVILSKPARSEALLDAIGAAGLDSASRVP